jgi:hypothetical protein
VQIATAHVEALELVAKLQAQVATATQVSGVAARDSCGDYAVKHKQYVTATTGTCLPCMQDSLQEVTRLHSIVSKLEEKHRLLEQQYRQCQLELQAAQTTKQEAVAELQELVGTLILCCTLQQDQ